MSRKYIKSPCTQGDLLSEGGIKGEFNQTFRSFEIIGVYLEYQDNGGDEDFAIYYSKCLDEKRYFYRNSGIRELYNQINKKIIESPQYHYSLSRHDLRRIGATYSMTPVRFYEAYHEVLETIFDYVFSDSSNNLRDQKRFREVFIDQVFESDISKFLTFENDCLNRYIGGGGNIPRNRYSAIRQTIIKLLDNYSNK